MVMHKIDYVVPMVFPDDAEWQSGFRKVGGAFRENNVRYRSWGAEHILIRLVKKNMPWLRDIVILLACKSQKKRWMDEEGVRVVYHSDFMPEKHLPTFNSSAFEMFLHRIPNLSDRFVYGNDDMFPLSPLSEEDFFVGGKPCLVMRDLVYPAKPSEFQKMCMNGLNFVAEEFGYEFKDSLLRDGHSITPILKSTCAHLWERGGDRIEASLSRFRAARNFNQYIYSWWNYLSKEYVDHAPKRKYISMEWSLSDIKKVILADDPGIVCINDSGVLRDCEPYVIGIKNALMKKL